MPINPEYLAKFEANKFYHVFNRSHSGVELFSDVTDYSRFILKMEEYITQVADVLAFNLIPNHFHMLIRVHDIPEEEILKKFECLNEMVKDKYRPLFISHTLYKNKREGRHGGLFSSPFRRKVAEDLDYIKQLFFYIHWNHVHHCMAQELLDYSYNSYQYYHYNFESFLNVELAYEIFGGRANFLREHELQKGKFQFGITDFDDDDDFLYLTRA